MREEELWPDARRLRPLCLCGPQLRYRTTDSRTTDLSPRSVFVRAKKLERAYAKRLRSVAAAIDHMVRGFAPLFDDVGALESMLRAYAVALNPWARSVAARMIAEVSARDDRSWQRVAATMGRELRREIADAPTGRIMRERLEDQVSLITSLPLEAAERVREIANENKVLGTRAADLSARIMETGEVTKARANLIARTETTRTATELTRARAEYVGSPGYLWVTAGDTDVRPSHKRLNGTYHRWNDPPECDPGYRAMPGCIFNCRCICEPVLIGDPDYDQYVRN